MQIIAQSQTPAKVTYHHLAYLAAQFSRSISKGELLPVQTILSAAVAAAIAFGLLGAKLAHAGRRGRAAKIAAVLGFVGMLVVLRMVQAEWSEKRSHEQVVNHVVQTGQWWALREAPIASAVEAAAGTNGAAASLAATYYDMKVSRLGERTPEIWVKAFRYSELAVAQGQEKRWIITPADPVSGGSRVEFLIGTYQAALNEGKLSKAEEDWARQQIARLTVSLGSKQQDAPKE